MVEEPKKNSDTVRIRVSELQESGFSGLDVHGDGAFTNLPALETHARHFNDLFESVYDAALVTSTNGEIVKCNGRASDFFQFSPREFVGRSILEVIAGLDRETVRLVTKTLKAERHVFIEATCTRQDGSSFPSEITVSLIRLFDEDSLCFFIRNITVRKETEDALQQAQRELVDAAHLAGMAEIAVGVLHDVGNLLNSVNVSCETILTKLRSSSLPSLEQAAELIQAQGEALPTFIAEDPRGAKLPDLMVAATGLLADERGDIKGEAERMLDRLRIMGEVVSAQQSYATHGLYRENADLNAVVTDALAILQASLAQSAIEVETDLQGVPSVQVQKTKVVHVLVNLIQNARDALLEAEGDKRQITISTSAAEQQVLLRVADNGKGIAADDLERVFSHGFTTKPDGHGFGLHTSANFMTEMDGTIEAESPGLGNGAAFTLSFPLEEYDA